MRILIITDAWAPQVNGVVKTYQKIQEQLTRSGDEVQVIHPGLYPNIPLFWYPEIRAALFPYRKVAKVIDSFRPEAIHIATEGPLGIVGRRICRQKKLAYTTAFHTRMPEYGQAYFRIPKPLSYSLLRWFHRFSSHVLVPTEHIAQILRENGIIRTKIWGRGINTHHYYPVEDSIYQGLPRPILLYVGRVAVEKNIQAFINLKSNGTKVVVGDGPQRKMLEKLYPEIVFAGYQHKEALNAYYSNADVLIFPSRTDTFGQVILESLACGTPVAAFRVPGPLDILGETALDTLHDDLNYSVERALVIDRNLCRPFSQHFTWEKSAAQFRNHLVPSQMKKDVYLFNTPTFK